MRRALPGGVELDDDRARVDIAAVHDFLSNESYWAKGRPLEVVERLVGEATRVVGAYASGKQIGFARTVSDGVSIAYLADVYVVTEWRGRGIGVEIVRASVDDGPFARTRWVLHTDSHEFYLPFGFGAPTERLMERPVPAD